MQEMLGVHIERDTRLAAFLDETLLAESVAQLAKYFADIPPELEILAPKTRLYLEGRVKVPAYSYGWAQPLAPHSQKIDMGINIADPIFEPPKREDIVKNLLAAVTDTLAAEEALFTRLAGREDIPPFEKPAEPLWQQRLEAPPDSGRSEPAIPWSDRTEAEKAFLRATEREEQRRRAEGAA